eukprot:Pgem_evm1s4544
MIFSNLKFCLTTLLIILYVHQANAVNEQFFFSGGDNQHRDQENSNINNVNKFAIYKAQSSTTTTTTTVTNSNTIDNVHLRQTRGLLDTLQPSPQLKNLFRIPLFENHHEQQQQQKVKEEEGTT